MGIVLGSCVPVLTKIFLKDRVAAMSNFDTIGPLSVCGIFIDDHGQTVQWHMKNLVQPYRNRGPVILREIEVGGLDFCVFGDGKVTVEAESRAWELDKDEREQLREFLSEGL